MRKLVIALIFIIIAGLTAYFFIKSLKARKETLKVAAILPLTGNNANYGIYIKNGLELAKEEINKRRAGGRLIEIIYEDDKAEPKQAINIIHKMIETDHPIMIFGPWASSCALAIAPIAEKNKIPVLAEAQSPQIRDAGDYIFRIQPDSRYYLKYLVPYCFDSLKLKRIAILFVNNDYGKDQSTVFETDFIKLGGTIVHKEGFPQDAKDFRTQLTKIKALNPDGIFIPAYVEAGNILKQATELALTCQFIGSAPMENPEIIKIAGPAANGVIYPHHFDPESQDSLIRNFINVYKNKYGTDAEGFGALAYDGLFIIDKLLEQCGEDKECIKKTLYQINFNGVTGKSSFDDHGDVIKPITIRKIVNQKFTSVMTFN